MSISNTLEILQTEFPLIDSSLVTALLSDYENPLTREIEEDDASLQSIRDTLTQLTLSVHSQDNQETSPITSLNSSEHNLELHDGSKEDSGDSRSRGARDDVTSTSESTTPSMTSMSSTGPDASNSNYAFASPVEFLNMLFPNLSPAVIDQAFLENYGLGVSAESAEREFDGNGDLSTVIDQLLSVEYIQDLAERGLEEHEHENEGENEWKIANFGVGDGDGNDKRALRLNAVPNLKKPKKSVNKIAFVDIRQRQHTVKPSVQSPTRSFVTDPWTRLSSISIRLSELLPPTPAGFFQSYFHSPQSTGPSSKAGWKMEGDALRHALSDLTKKRSRSHLQTTGSNSNTFPTTLKASIDKLRDIIIDPGSDNSLVLNNEQLLELERDAKLCITAANGDIDTALNLLWLLKELDEAFVTGAGVAHLQPYTNGNGKDTQHSLQSSKSSSAATALASRTNDTKPTPTTFPSAPSPLSIRFRPPDPSRPNLSWTTVQRRRSPKVVSPHVDHIPAYSNPIRQKQSVRGSGNRFGKGGKGDIGELDRDLAWYRDQRKDALHQASRLWKSGSTKNRGGEIAFYYAEKARDFQEQAHAKALEIARTVVREKSHNLQEQDTLDLHGLTIAEARAIVREVVQTFDFSNARDLTIITGRGKHSADQVSVLGPAIKDMLTHEGYKVTTWDGGLSVRGR